MDKTKIELKVGFFVLIGIVLISFLIFKIGNIKNYGAGYSIKFIFNRIAGVKAGSPVRLSGVDIGEITEVKIVEDEENKKIKVEALSRIRGSLLIPHESSAYVSTLGLLGEKYIEIVPPEVVESFLKPGDKLVGVDPVLAQDWVDEAQKTVKDFQELISNLKDGEGTVGKLLFDDRLYQELEALVTDLRQHPWKLFWKTKEKKTQ